MIPSELGSALINHLWQSTVVVGVAWVLAWALRKNHARARYWVWMAASVKFLLPFSVLMTAGEWLRSLMVTPVVVRPAVANVMEQVAQPFAQAQILGTASPVVAQHANWLPVVLLSVWACGALVVAIRFGRGWWRVWCAKRAALKTSNRRSFDSVAAATFAQDDKSGFAVDVPVMCTAELMEPGIFGIFRPVLLMPEGILERLTAEQMRAIVAHEMCHVRWRDNLTFAVHMIVEAVFWFHPLVWWIGARLIDERERACDEAVVEAGGKAEVYAEGILNVCKFYVELPAACVAGVTGADLKRRIVRIMTHLAIRKMGFGRKLLLAITSVIAIATPVVLGVVRITKVSAQAATAQGIVGIWQGTLHDPRTNRDLRTEIRIVAADGGRYKATFYIIGQGAQPIPANSVTLEGPTVKMAFSFIGGKFEGTLSKDRSTIGGEWSQEPSWAPLPLTLTRAAPETAWAIPTPPPPIPPMADNASPSFEVATVKPSKPGEGKRFGFNGREFFARSASLDELLALAYGVDAEQIVNAPHWAGTDLYDIVVLPDAPGRPDITQMGIMMQKLLASRFQLKFHREARVLSVYAITVAKDGPKMAKDAGPAKGPQAFALRGFGDLFARNMTMKYFALVMQSTVLDRPVVDETGLTDRYDFELKWMPDDSQFVQFTGDGFSIPPAGDNATAPPSLYTAVQEQLGLKIEATKAPDEVLVIDEVERPSEN